MLALIDQAPPDAVVPDPMMSVFDGYEVRRRPKANRALADLASIFLTARRQEQGVVSALAPRECDGLARPLIPDEPVARLNRLIEVGHRSASGPGRARPGFWFKLFRPAPRNQLMMEALPRGARTPH